MCSICYLLQLLMIVLYVVFSFEEECNDWFTCISIIVQMRWLAYLRKSCVKIRPATRSDIMQGSNWDFLHMVHPDF